MYNSYFVFKGTYYLQQTGVPISGPLAGVMAELIVRHKEVSVIEVFKAELKLYTRYVDDDCVIWRGTSRHQSMADQFTDCTLGLKVKVEQMSNDGFHFLDVSVRTEEGEYVTDIYRKPTHSPVFILAWSHDPYTYKLATFRSMYSRACMHITKWSDRLKEVHYIMAQVYIFGYTYNVMIRIWKKIAGRMLSPQCIPIRSQDTNNTRRYVDLKYDKRFSNLLNRLAKSSDRKIAWKRGSTVFDNKKNAKEPIPKHRKPGIYTIPIYNNSAGKKQCYVGSTTRNVSKRISEHKADIMNGKLTTALASRFYEQDLMID